MNNFGNKLAGVLPAVFSLWLGVHASTTLVYTRRCSSASALSTLGVRGHFIHKASVNLELANTEPSLLGEMWW